MVIRTIFLIKIEILLILYFLRGIAKCSICAPEFLRSYLNNSLGINLII